MIRISTTSITMLTMMASPAIADGGNMSAHVQNRGPANVELANRNATLTPKADAFLNAVQVYPYSAGTIYKLITAPERITDIALEQGEMLVSVASGDTVRWVIGDTSSGSGAAKRTHILIKPSLVGLSTNLLITTDRRAYHLALVSTGRTALTGISWSYPEDALLALHRASDAARAAEPIAVGIQVEQLHFNYEISGDAPAWRPLRAFDDGRQTYIEFPASIVVGDAPPLFLVDGKGAAQLVNYRLKDHFYIVDRIFDQAELRFGTRKQQVVRVKRMGATRRRRSS
ncbi:P-type conjugative transfer protein TrbG [Sphingobium sp. TB-6]|uniref:P-type conjugative transfer protein TrbG n=1 Tax=Sphingobium sp. TB-6 TaxID=2728850 RepID=UPI00146A6F6D|nr:P-type conjugative transfer protein TrbG [Sphingobium sp. TB-6]NML88158.1 P-type conjugative transfer protein TrbG [Sphingobium sp. TB-6]